MGKMKSTYYNLSSHSRSQFTIFFILVVVFSIGIFHLLMPVLQQFIETYLRGVIYNAGETLPFSKDIVKIESKTNFYTQWAVDTYVGTIEETRYWINPILSFTLPVLLLSTAISLVLTAIVPRNIGYMRQKIEREIALVLNKIAMSREGFVTSETINETEMEIINADIKTLDEIAETSEYTIEDLKVLRKALKWIRSNALWKLLNLNAGMQIYMRFYFTEIYSNTVLGLVYMGAAFLIIIIGLRGLKFIPSTQPSLVFFALGLEFNMLFTYAFTLMFSRQEDVSKETYHGNSKNEMEMLSNQFGSDKQVERLLRVFIKSTKDK